MDTREFTKNGVRYRRFPGRARKMCQIPNCPGVASGTFCVKHKPVVVNSGQQQCHRCWKIFSLESFRVAEEEYTHCTYCREYKRQSSLRHHQRRREFLLQLKIEKGGVCVDCGNDDLEVLEFDHVSTEDAKVAEVRRIYNNQGMVDEAAKTELRCVNCHMKKLEYTTPREPTEDVNLLRSREYRDATRTYIKQVKMESGGCQVCHWFDETNLQALHFDHIDENTKLYNINELSSTGCNLDRLKTELAKCQILCGNCHRKRTLRQFNYPIVEMIAARNQT